MGISSGRPTHCLTVTWFDCLSTNSIRAIATPTRTACCKGMIRQKTKVMTMTTRSTIPVFHTLDIWLGLSVRKPMTINSPAMAGKAI